jgi:hypothetical protein
LAALGGTGGAVAGGVSKVGGAVVPALGKVVSGGGGMSTYEKLALGSAIAGGAAGAYGAYQEGKGSDADRALAARQWDQEFGRQTGLDVEDARRFGITSGENTRQFDVTTGEGQRQFNENLLFDREGATEDTRRFDVNRADTRGDVEYERDLTKRKATAYAPYLGKMLARRY